MNATPWRGRIGRALLALSVVGAVAVLAVRLTGLQELHAVLLGVAGAGDVLLGLCAAGALAGALLCVGTGAVPGWVAGLAVAVPGVAALQVVWPALVGTVAPEDARWGHPLSVVAQNVWASNPDPGAAAREVLAQRADVLVLSEFTPAHLRAFRRAGAERRYPYQVVRHRADTQGMAVMSRVPLVPARRQPPLFRTVVRLEPRGARPVTLVAVHLPAPNRPGQVPYWRRELRATTRDARRAGDAVVVAGDLNSGDGHRPFRAMAAAAGLRSAQDHGGGGTRDTWPVAGHPFPPVMRLDHVLVGDAVGVTDFGFLPPVGADHLGVRARLRVPAA